MDLRAERRGSSRRTSKVTLRDVAEAAGVSTMTVSNVIHDRAYVSPELKARVTKQIKSLGYVPNRAAQELAGVTRPHFALLYPNLTNPFIAAVIIGTMNAAARAGIEVSIQLAQLNDADALRKTMRRMEDAGIDGYLLPSPMAEFAAQTFKDEPLRRPVVAIAAGTPLDGIPSVRADEKQAAFELVKLLLDHGHRRIGYLSGPTTQSGTVARREGYCSALVAGGIVPRDDYVVKSAFNFREGVEAARTLLDREPRVTAVFAANDTLAAAVLSVAHERGIEVPKSLSVVGYDDSIIAEQTWPALTTVRQNAAEMSERAVETLHQNLRAAKEGSEEDYVAEVILPFKIIHRASVAAAPND